MSKQDINRLFAKNILHYLKLNKMTQAELASKMHVSTATASNWCIGSKFPRRDKVNRICELLNIGISDLMDDQNHSPSPAYYLNKDTGDITKFMFDNPEYKVLFDAVRRVKKEDIEFVREMMERMSDN